MIDNFGRNIDYIRISVTDRCNLRCVYCMPEEGVENIMHRNVLTFDEILRICKVLAKNGLKKVKITGGEPLVRRGVANLIKQIIAGESPADGEALTFADLNSDGEINAKDANFMKQLIAGEIQI